jgi:hypothetical protein
MILENINFEINNDIYIYIYNNYCLLLKMNQLKIIRFQEVQTW